MEEYNFNTDGTNHSDDGQKETPQMTGDDVSTNTSVDSHAKKETKNPQIPSDEAPFVVLCGPPSSGKSMVLKCLASYLYGSKYSISANNTLLSDEKYQTDCQIFNDIIVMFLNQILFNEFLPAIIDISYYFRHETIRQKHHTTKSQKRARTQTCQYRQIIIE